MNITSPSNYGPLVVSRFGLEGFVCYDNFTEADALTACRTIGFRNGHTIKVVRGRRLPLTSGKVICDPPMSNFKDCSFNTFGQDPECQSDNIAGVICYNNGEYLNIFYVCTVI